MTVYTPAEVRPSSLIPRLVVALVLFAAGLGFVGYGASTGADRFAYPLSAPFQSGTFTQQLKTGRYLVYAPDASAVHETPTNLSVTAPDASSVTVTAFTGTETQTRDGNGYSAYAQFRAASPGRYRFSLSANGPPRIIIARTLVDSLKALIGPAVEVVVGAILAIVALVVLLRAFTRRRWQRRTAPAQWAQPWNPAVPGSGQEWNVAPGGPPPPSWYPPGAPAPAEPQPQRWYPPDAPASAEPQHRPPGGPS